MGILIAFGTDDGEHLNNDHVGTARYFYVYDFADRKEKLVEQRTNTSFKGDESIKHGDPEKAKATSSILQNVDVLVGKKFGPNLPRLLKKFVCVLVRTDSLGVAVQVVRQNIDRVAQELDRGEDRKHIILKP